MNPEQWLSLKWNGGSTMSDRWLNQSKIIQRGLEIMLTIDNLIAVISLCATFYGFGYSRGKHDAKTEK